MTDLRTVAQQALEALEESEQHYGSDSALRDAIQILRAALEQEDQEYTGIPGTNVRVRIPTKYRDPSCVGAFNRAKPEHITDGTPCWCNPELDYVDPETGVKVWVHKEPQ
jgi:hypothetical protein